MEKQLVGWVCLAGLVVLLMPGWSKAKTLGEILREKGVITSQEYAAAAKGNGQVRYQAGKGLTAVSADGNSSLRLRGW